MDPIRGKLGQFDAAPIQSGKKISSKGGQANRFRFKGIGFDDSNNKLAVKVMKEYHTKNPPKLGWLERKYNVLISSQTKGGKLVYLKVNKQSLSKRLGIDKNTLNKEMKNNGLVNSVVQSKIKDFNKVAISDAIKNKNEDLAVEIATKATRLRSGAEVAYILAQAYKNGEFGDDRDAEASEWLEKAGKKGHPDALYQLAQNSTKKKDRKKYLEKAAKNGHEKAKIRLAEILLKEHEKSPSHIALNKAGKQVRPLAESGNADANFMLARIDYAWGRKREAIVSMQKAINGKTFYLGDAKDLMKEWNKAI